jgi:trigger factor
MKPGETRTIEVTFPADYAAPNLAGKPATFEINAKKLSRSVVPEMDDELAKKLGFDDLPAMREAVTGRFQGEYDQMSRLRLKRDLLDKLAEVAKFASPEGMVEQEFSQIWQRLETDRKEGRLDDDDKDKDDETLKAEYRGIAERRVRLGLLLGEIGRVNSITVAPDEMARAMRMEAMRYPGQEQQIMEFFRQNPRASDTLRGPIYEEEGVADCAGTGQGEDRSSPSGEPAEEPPASRQAQRRRQARTPAVVPRRSPRRPTGGPPRRGWLCHAKRPAVPVGNGSFLCTGCPAGWSPGRAAYLRPLG